jgi:hypothetical protein
LYKTLLQEFKLCPRLDALQRLDGPRGYTFGQNEA